MGGVSQTVQLLDLGRRYGVKVGAPQVKHQSVGEEEWMMVTHFSADSCGMPWENAYPRTNLCTSPKSS